jgi:hypothetical protein
MLSSMVPKSQQSAAEATALRGHPGCWRLEVGRTLALRPRQRSVMTVVQGRVWITQEQGARERGARDADCFLGPGECWEAAPGRLVVLEPVGAAPVQAVAFRWERAGALARCQAPARQAWAAAMCQPRRELAQALREAGRALRAVGGGRGAPGGRWLALVIAQAHPRARAAALRGALMRFCDEWWPPLSLDAAPPCIHHRGR